ncbi:hypothetical protein GP486_002947 [Trichoglossum hirsutum]|uniref:ER-bound oxygenase mpaB/mpaB'/Rubber oxygenase catalytic domain-containing protein n=1 Tax=Trichoglossum hirsutum TaxID=265104 RepID=A0A9P8LDZ8_9PEZI|nr:hypothetical protein GP486_002947 [Trichoglossum hirsutum]
MTMWFAQWEVLLPGAILYLYFVKRFRFYRSETMPSRLGYTNRKAFSRMTVEDAWKIHNFLVEFEFPTIFSTATMFALFKAYGIPSISSLLCMTGQFSSKDTVDKRYTDTGCLLLEAVLNPPASPRAIEAIARINYLHSTYRATGKITDADMLYTLSLFALEPSRWVAKYEWRELTSLEKCAVGTLWKRLGDALGVNFDLLPGSREGLGRWGGVAGTTGQLESRVPGCSHGARTYEQEGCRRDFVPHCVEATNEIQAHRKADSRGDSGGKASRSYDSYLTFIRTFNSIRKFVLLRLTLPRVRPKKRLPIAASSGRIHARRYNIQPWYVKPTIVSRCGPAAWRTWLQGGVLPGDQGDKYFPQGFIASELGPTTLRECGKEKMEAERQRLESELTSEIGKCPFLAQERDQSGLC